MHAGRRPLRGLHYVPGTQSCRTASARTRELALRTATENACAQISSGVTDSNQCNNTPPDSVRWPLSSLQAVNTSPKVLRYMIELSR